jgi:glucose/arabinose dehydrogenase
MKSLRLIAVGSAAAFVVALAAVTAPSPAVAGDARVTLIEVASNFTAPSVLVPLDPGRMLLCEQPGDILIMTKDGKSQPFFDVRGRMTQLKAGFDERGLLGLALHPKFKDNGRFYLCYSAPKRAGAPEAWDHTMHISEFKVKAANKNEGDPASERVLLQIDEPYFNHNGGRIAFGSDGFLYIGVGDGGHKNDINMKEGDQARGPHGNGQDVNVLLAKILRIDVDKAEGGRNYAIPSDNPFAKGGGRPEIFAWGIRNPWGISFDRGGKHELFACDIGQSRWEEINLIVKGGNYGWNLKEGKEWFNPKRELAPLDAPYFDPGNAKFIDPIIAYGNLAGYPQDGKGRSVTGGYVYRGKALPELVGKYVFADWSRNMGRPEGVLLIATRPASGSGEWKLEQIEPASHPGQNMGIYVWAFGEDDEGELYLLTNATSTVVGKTGKVWKLVRAKS